MASALHIKKPRLLKMYNSNKGIEVITKDTFYVNGDLTPIKCATAICLAGY